MRRAEVAASQLLKRGPYEQVPIPVERIAADLGARVSYQSLESEVAGMLFRDGKQVLIGVNSAHPLTRQRFTLAHEIGHLVMHRGNTVHVDRLRVNFRDANSSKARDNEEIAANAFAAALLMPATLLAEAVRLRLRQSRDASPDEMVEPLATRFKVSRQAMQIRLTSLGFLMPW